VRAAASGTAAPAKPAPKPAPKVAPPPPPEPSLVDDLLENPWIPGAVLGVLALLLGAGVYRIRQRRKSTQVDSSFLESRLQPDSFFGASGGQRIDTGEGATTGSSMVYSPSQLDAAGDVDPVAEADVYLAYGRDLQAEEILKEALRTNPQRVAIHAKLLEIYAKRRDLKAFEMVATDAYNLTGGAGAEWEHICELGRELDPGNPMYRPGGQPGEAAMGAAATGAAAGAAALAAAAMPAREDAHAAASNVDLDLDFSLGDEPDAPPPPPPSAASRARAKAEAEAAQELARAAAAPPPLEMDFGEATGKFERAAEPPAPELPHIEEPEAVRLDAPGLTLNENSLAFTAEPAPAPPPPPPPRATAAPAPAAPDPGMIEFDLGALSLDLPASGTPAAAEAPIDALAMPDETEDPLATKLALAEEFNAIGDADGARSLAEEVVAEASGDLKSRAQRLLAEIG
jgi:pilus assembly protein FimV